MTIEYGTVGQQIDRRIVGKDGVVADLALVRHMRVAEKEIVVADASWGFGAGAAMDGHVFAEGVVIPNVEVGFLPLELEILGAASKGGKGKRG